MSRPPEEPGYGEYPVVGTGDERDSWMAVDLGEGRRFALDHYALRNDGFGLWAPRSWDLEGADTMEGPWTTLRSHEDDGALPSNQNTYDEAAWPVDGAGAFRCFRIRITGGNAGGDYRYLCCAGIELYGSLV